jgi:hypothetical protein
MGDYNFEGRGGGWGSVFSPIQTLLKVTIGELQVVTQMNNGELHVYKEEEIVSQKCMKGLRLVIRIMKFVQQVI